MSQIVSHLKDDDSIVGSGNPFALVGEETPLLDEVWGEGKFAAFPNIHNDVVEDEDDEDDEDDTTVDDDDDDDAADFGNGNNVYKIFDGSCRHLGFFIGVCVFMLCLVVLGVFAWPFWKAEAVKSHNPVQNQRAEVSQSGALRTSGLGGQADIPTTFVQFGADIPHYKQVGSSSWQ